MPAPAAHTLIHQVCSSPGPFELSLARADGRSDPAVKQILLQLDESGPARFITADLDDTHLVVNSSAVDQMRAALAVELEKNNYVAAE